MPQLLNQLSSPVVLSAVAVACAFAVACWTAIARSIRANDLEQQLQMLQEHIGQLEQALGAYQADYSRARFRLTLLESMGRELETLVLRADSKLLATAGDGLLPKLGACIAGRHPYEDSARPVPAFPPSLSRAQLERATRQ